MGPEWPLIFVSCLCGKFVLAIFSFLDETVFHHFVKHRIDRPWGGSPPSLCHVLYFIHYLHPVLRGASQERENQGSEPAFAEVSKSTKHSISLFRYWISDTKYKDSLLSGHVTRRSNKTIRKSPVSSPKSRSEQAHPATGIIHAVNAHNLPPIQTQTVP